MTCHRHMDRRGFTLFEVILAVALSTALFALIGTAINLYLMRIEADRTEVEETQLARTILTMIAADIRATTVYQPQDMGTIGQLMSAAAEFDVDSIDAPGSGGGSGGASAGGATSGSGSGGGTSSTGSGAGAGQSGSGSTQPTETVPLGLNGLLYEMSVDISRLPKSDELFSVITGYTNAPSMVAGTMPAQGTSAIVRPSDVKTVRYFVRQGVQIDPDSVSATLLAPAEQLRASGLVRQEIDRATRNWADVSADSAILESGQTLLAPEVVKIEFRYFDGKTVTDTWDMLERSALPLAIEIRIWLVSSHDAATGAGIANYYTDPASYAREYRQTVYLPMSAVASSSATSGAGSTGGSSTSSSDSSSGADGSGAGFGTGSASGAGFGSGSGFGQSQ